MPLNRQLRLIKTYRQRQKKPGETIKETSKSVRPEWVSKRPSCMLASCCWWWWWRRRRRHRRIEHFCVVENYIFVNNNKKRIIVTF